MKHSIPAFLLLAFAAVEHTAQAQNTLNFPTIGNVERHDKRLDDLISPDAKIEVLSSGYRWSEGPVWIQDGQYLLFSDVQRNTIIKWKEREGPSIFMEPSGYTGVSEYSPGLGSNGLAIDAQGQLIICEHGDRRVSVLTKNGGKRTLSDNYQGRRFNSPNDIVIASNGDMYFTDPPYGLPKDYQKTESDLDYAGVFLRRTDGEVELLTKELPWPNGITLSLDEKTLYVAQSSPTDPILMQYPVNDDGGIDKGSILADFSIEAETMVGLVDGVRVDSQGNIWCSGPGGIIILSPKGDKLGHIKTGERVANLCWGNDGHTLYITSHMYLCRIKTKVKGAGF